MPRRWTLRTRIAIGLFTYSLLLGIAVLAFGYATNESIERVVWRSLLQTEADRFQVQRATDPGFPLPHSGAIRSYLVPAGGAGGELPQTLRGLAPGVYNQIELGGREVSVLIRDQGNGQRLYLVVEAEEVERQERNLFGWVIPWALAGVALLVGVTYWLAGRLLSPVSQFVRTVDELHPGSEGRLLQVDQSAGAEIATLAQAMNSYLERIEGFVAREHRFVATMSHELRTPLASLHGAVDVLAERDDLAPEARRVLERIRRTLIDSDQLVEALLLLARDPARLTETSESVAVDRLLQEVIDAHVHLMPGKPSEISAGVFPPVAVLAPVAAVKVAISNLLRNAIEHGGAGTIEVALSPDADISIRSPRQGLSPGEIARLYTEAARRGTEQRRGIGLELIARLCEHMGWKLQISDTQDEVSTVLQLRPRG